MSAEPSPPLLTEVLAEVERWEPSTVAVGVTSDTTTLATHGPTDRPFPLASVTKPLTAYGLLIASEQGELHLDEPVAAPQLHDGATVRHLLAHASGAPPEPDGPSSPPEHRRTYADWAYGLLGDLVAQRTGIAFATYLEVEVTEPLGMTATALRGPAGNGAVGSLADLLRFGRELLAPSLLSEDLLAEATRPAFPGLDGVLPGFGRYRPNDWGLGFELKGDKQDHWMGRRLAPSTFGHFGRSGAFLWVDPTRGLAAVELADQPFGEWARRGWGPFNDQVVAAVAP